MARFYALSLFIVWIFSISCERITIQLPTATLQRIAIIPSSKTLPANVYFPLQAIGYYSDGTTNDLTSQAGWASANSSIASVSVGGPTLAWVMGQSAGSTQIVAFYGNFSAQSDLTITTATLSSISVTPANSSKAKGLTQQFTASGIYSDASVLDITTSVTWSSSNTSVVTVSDTNPTKGLASTPNQGVVTIQASLNAVNGTTSFTVNPPSLVSIAVTPANFSRALGLTQQFTATGTYTDSSTANITTSVSWSSSNISKVTISNSNPNEGLATTHTQGSVSIDAILSGITGSAFFFVDPPSLVSIAVTPANSSIAKGLTQQFTATGTYTDSSTADITSSVTWSSTDNTKVTISNSGPNIGLASTPGLGAVTVQASSGTVNGATSFTVNPPTLVSIAVTPANSVISVAANKQFTATGTYTDSSTADLTTSVTWASSNPMFVTISNSAGTEGKATGLGIGSTVISATLGAIVGQTNLNGIL